MYEEYNIKNATTFEEVVKSRQFTYAGIDMGNFGVSIFSSMYANPAHFIYELLQNAEDAGAHNVRFDLQENALLFFHDGEKLFDLNDLKGITGYAQSAKQDKFGKFGLGFKAVYTICKTPLIYSGDMCFQINNFIIPSEIEPKKEYSRGTYFILPFESDKMDTAAIYKMIYEELSNLPSDSILFTKNIKKIDWNTCTINGSIKKEYDLLDGATSRKCTLRFVIDNEKRRKTYLIFSKPWTGNEKKDISIAFRYSEDQKSLRAEKASNISVLFPTRVNSNLKFKIDGPFETTQTRESLNEDNTKHNINKQILSELLELYNIAINKIQEYNLYLIDTIKILPYQDIYQTNFVYDAFKESTRNYFLNCAAIPTSNGLQKKEYCVIAGAANLKAVFSPDDFYKLFSKHLVLDITDTDEFHDIYNFFTKSLKIRSVEIEAIFTAIKEDTFEGKSVEWFEKFYALCNQRSSQWLKKQRNKAIILTDSGDVKPVVNDSDVPIVFLPGESSLNRDKTRIVNCILLNTDAGKAFFDTMEIGIQDVADYILEDWLPALIGESDPAQYCEDLAVIADEYKKMPLIQQEKIIDAFKKEKCIAVSYNDRYALVQAEYAYFNTDINRTMYADAFNAFILCEDLQELTDKNIDVKQLLLKLGVCNFIRFNKNYCCLASKYKEKMRADSRYTYEYDSAYCIVHIDNIIQHITPEISRRLWNTLKDLPNEYHTGTYFWDYSHSRTSRTIKAYFYFTLDTAQWLYNTDGELITPADITYREIAELYGENKNLEEHINFKEDAVSQLPQDFQRVYSLMRKGVPAEVLEQFAAQYLEQQTESKVVLSDPTVGESVVYTNSFNDKGTDEIACSDVLPNINSVASDTFTSSIEDSSTKQSDREVRHTAAVTTHSNIKVKLGVWGEKKVISVLAKEYETNGYDVFNVTENEFSAEKDNKLICVRRMNNDQKNQCGYDILISENGEVAKYIEVKCKSNKQKESFPVHGAQWEFAKSLSLKGEGNKYCLYVVVYNDGSQTKTEISRIEDPYKAWADGKLFADPINIIV
ncbi:MAG: DUF3883 domain-containing protein [Clostridiales bacterium]|nr:DUF3883 domain-containing protein [Clostridiales bacterium]